MLKPRLRMLGLLGPILLLSLLLFGGVSPSRAAGCEDKIARHMVGEAMLAAQFVAAAEKNGMPASAINTALKTLPPIPPFRNSGSPIRRVTLI